MIFSGALSVLPKWKTLSKAGCFHYMRLHRDINVQILGHCEYIVVLSDFVCGLAIALFQL